MPLDATIAGATSNSYIDVDYANTYFTHHPYSNDWDGSDKEISLVYATMLLDTVVDWIGEKQTTTQALKWPRILEDNLYYNEIPSELGRATCELALHLIKNTQLFESETIEKLTVGPIKLDFNVDDITQLLPQLVVAMISNYGSVLSGDAGGIQTPRLIRV